MKTSITDMPESNPEIPKVGQCFRYLDDEVFIRINGEQGAKAYKREYKGEMYAVSLRDGELSSWGEENSRAEGRLKSSRP